MKNLAKTCLYLLIFLNFQTLKAQQDNWTHFRGSNLNGISETKVAPIAWNDSTNILWNTNLDGKSG